MVFAFWRVFFVLRVFLLFIFLLKCEIIDYFNTLIFDINLHSLAE